MFEALSKIPFGSAGNASRLYLDYLSGINKGVPPFLAAVSGKADFWQRKTEAVLGAAREGREMAEVLAEVREVSTRLGSRETVVKKLDSPAPMFVVTGQQPGVLGGPLMTLYKIATAVALAERVEKTTGEPCVALYWCGSDDTDFKEIRELHLLTQDASPIATDLPQSSHGTGEPVGDIEGSVVQKLWEGIRGFVEAFGSGHAAKIDDALSRGRDHGEMAAAVLLQVLEGQFAVVDARSGAVRRGAARLFRDYVATEDEVKKQVREAGAELEKRGYHAQLSPGEDSGVFLMEDGRRKTITKERRRALLDAVESDVGRCAPGVVLRNLVQDEVFRPVAVVLGPAEIAYRAQIAGLYDRFGVMRPVELPRLGATFVPQSIAGVVCEAEELVREPAACVKQVYRDSIPEELTKAVGDFKRRVDEAVKAFGAQVESAVEGRARGKVEGRLRDLSARAAQVVDSVDDVGRGIALSKWPFLSELPLLIRPEEKFQERYYSCVTPFLFGGKSADVSSMIALAHGHIDELLDRRAAHIVYSTKS